MLQIVHILILLIVELCEEEHRCKREEEQHGVQ